MIYPGRPAEGATVPSQPHGTAGSPGSRGRHAQTRRTFLLEAPGPAVSLPVGTGTVSASGTEDGGTLPAPRRPKCAVVLASRVFSYVLRVFGNGTCVPNRGGNSRPGPAPPKDTAQVGLGVFLRPTCLLPIFCSWAPPVPPVAAPRPEREEMARRAPAPLLAMPPRCPGPGLSPHPRPRGSLPRALPHACRLWHGGSGRGRGEPSGSSGAAETRTGTECSGDVSGQ